MPWNDTYRHVWYEGMMDKGAIRSTFMTTYTTNYTYIREDTNIRVPYNADDLYGVNYCMYQNNGMWFCAFVNTITYVNNNTSLLHLKEDVWHTWGGSATFHACFVEREHATSDGMGQHRAPEPAMALESVVVEEDDFNVFAPDTVIVGTNAIPHLKSGVSGNIFGAHSETDFDGSDAVAGGFYGYLFSGAKYYAFDTSQGANLMNFLDNLNKSGAAESICCMFMVPSSTISRSGFEVTGVADYHADGSITAPRTLGNGYTPRNKKCLTYPYAYVTITDYTGGEMDLKYEDCDVWGSVDYRIRQALDPTASAIFTARNHMGASLDMSHMMPISQNPQCSWVYSAYQNWAAQNANSINVKHTLNSFGVLAGLLMTGVGIALAGTGVLSPAGGALGTMGINTLTAAGLGLAASSTMSEVNNLTNIDAQSKVPNRTIGSCSGNTLAGIGRGEGGYRCVALQFDSARRLDMFFDVFGYQTELRKVPNLTGRPAWNYVKTVGCNIQGAIPADRLKLMCKRMDDGMTFWHNSDVGNYNLNNQI